MIGRILGGIGRLAMDAAMAVRSAGRAVANDPHLQHMGRLGAFELGEALRATPDANIAKVNLGLLTSNSAALRQAQMEIRQSQARTLDRGKEMDRG